MALVTGNSDLNTLHGVDVTAGVSRFGGNEARYRYWLEDFTATADGAVGAIRREVAYLMVEADDEESPEE